MASVIGEEELSESDRQILTFGKAFEQRFLDQGMIDRSMEETLDLGWELLRLLPRRLLDRIDDKLLDEYYDKKPDAGR